MKYIFFGTDDFSVAVLNELKGAGFLPTTVVTVPDMKMGRGQKVQKPAVKIWAESLNIQILQPEKLNAEEIMKEIGERPDLFIVASYGKIIPGEVLEIPNGGALNVHPSLLPKYRGASPIESAILNDDNETGVTIMLMDEKMDHGPIIDQIKLSIDEWQNKVETENMLASAGGKLLAKIIPLWLDVKISETEQNHNESTYTKKIEKSDGLLDYSLAQKLIEESINKTDSQISNEEKRKIFLRIIALNPWPSVFFIMQHRGIDMRIKILEAKWINNNLEIKTVLPEGRKPMSWDSFIDGYCKNK